MRGMSVKRKLTALFLIAFVANILLLIGYYNLFLADLVSENFAQVQQALDDDAARAAQALQMGGIEALDALFDGQETLRIDVQDAQGRVVYTRENKPVTALHVKSIHMLHTQQDAYMLVLTRYLPVGQAWQIHPARYLLIAEMVILLFMLVIISVCVYLIYVRPIEKMQRQMQAYAKGQPPERWKRRDEIGQLQNDFVNLTGALEAEKQKQNQLIASISHDIKTPLTSVMGYAEQMRKKHLPPERQMRYVDIMYQKAVAIKELVEEFDDYLGCRLRSGLRTQLLTGQALVQILRADYEDDLQQVDITFDIEPAAKSSTVRVDVNRIRRVLGNLVANSIRHAGVADVHIAVRCTCERQALHFCVCDNGLGTDAATLDRLFDPLFTSDESRSVAGLGLAICKEIVQAHGGEIRACNVPSGGFCIHFTLPVVGRQQL